MSTVERIQAAILQLPRAEVEELRMWIDEFIEDQLEFTEEVKSKLDQSQLEMADLKKC